MHKLLYIFTDFEVSERLHLGPELYLIDYLINYTIGFTIGIIINYRIITQQPQKSKLLLEM